MNCGEQHKVIPQGRGETGVAKDHRLAAENVAERRRELERLAEDVPLAQPETIYDPGISNTDHRE